MKIRYLTAALAVASLGFAGCGGDNSSSASGSSSGNGVDRAFVAAMIPHHKSAVDMAKIAQDRGQSQFVRDLADNIVSTQTEEISTMRKADSRLKSAGVEKGDLGVDMSMMTMDMKMLESTNQFDDQFTKMMVAHHSAAITMAKAELQKGSDPELTKLAQQIIDAQQMEIDDMQAFRKKSGLPAASMSMGGGMGS